jgi:hypothetical protein
MRQREALRKRFLPSTLRLLLIGESPPASGRFFYQCDSGLYRATRDAFRRFDDTITDENFLATFQSSGCYLIDLCREPVDHLTRKDRVAACVLAEPLLTRKIQNLKPQAIAIVVRSIELNVERAILRAVWKGPILKLPYPGRWSRHRAIYVNTLAQSLGDLEAVPESSC